MYKASYDGSNKKVLWQELWRHEFEAALAHDPVVILPTGSIEQHGPHCPMDVDIVGLFAIAVAAAQRVGAFPCSWRRPFGGRLLRRRIDARASSRSAAARLLTEMCS
jgi:hypothetical protein